jgi:hypothetical protein
VTSVSYKIVINGQLFTVDLPELAPVQIRALAGIPAHHTLVIEGQGSSADLFLAEDALVSLKNGPVHVYTMPPTAMG